MKMDGIIIIKKPPNGKRESVCSQFVYIMTRDKKIFTISKFRKNKQVFIIRNDFG